MKLLVRLAVILGGSLLFSTVMTNLFPTEDANIGAGLIYFALLLTVSGIWGLWDGHHAATLPPVFVRWALIAGVVGLSGRSGSGSRRVATSTCCGAICGT
ncbi:hypothetical protein ABT304_28810 [Nocardioides sp. NPDC000445]|uniref:hypothetical protein n=1 Tax=Nocardioides sp. NPDC000445 TaxID=3154257 RepID=UPI00331BF5B6